jgi:hypothetical protein
MSNGLFEHRGAARQVAVAPVTPWVLAHEGVLEVAQERARLERREGTSLLRAFRERVHRHLGYGGFAEYTDRHLGYCHRTTADKLRTAGALEQLPELALAQKEGRLHASAVRELARVATAAGRVRVPALQTRLPTRWCRYGRDRRCNVGGRPLRRPPHGRTCARRSSVACAGSARAKRSPPRPRRMHGRW